MMTMDQKNEGEGNKTADRAYRKKTKDFIESGKVDAAAKKARDARDGSEKDALNRAEEKGRKPARS